MTLREQQCAGGSKFPTPAECVKRMLEPELAARILHGSDVPVPVPVTGAVLWTLGMTSWREWRATARLANSLERVAQIKRALGFGEDTFTRLVGLLRKRE